MRWIPILFFVTILCLGCGNSAVSRTSVHTDGSWTRSIEYKIGKNARTSASKAISETIVPPQGTTWKAEVLTRKNEAIWRGSRTLPTGESLTDLQLRGWNSSHKSMVIASNLVSVRDLGKGTYEFIETVKWHGKIAKFLSTPYPPLASILRPLLPEDMRRVKSDGTFVVSLQRVVFRDFFGLNSPVLLASSMRQALLQVREQLRESIILLLQKQSPSPLTALQLQKTAQEIIDALESNHSQLLGFARSNADDNPDLLVTARLSFPGDVIETNGLVNLETGEISWKYLSDAAMVAPIQLRCVFTLKEGGEGHRARQAQSRR